MSKISKQKIFEKHPPMTEEQILETKLKQKATKKAYENEVINYEQNLLTYFKKTIPIISEDGITLAVIRYPSYKELMDIVPPELRKYSENPQDIPRELEEKYAERHFEIMAMLIEQPKKTAIWWKDNTTMEFIALFNEKLAEIVKVTTEEAENFRKAPKG